MIDNDLMKDAEMQDAARRRLAELVETSRSDLKSLSLHLGRNPTYLQQYLSKGSPRQLAWEDRVELARILRCTPEELSLSGGGKGGAAQVSTAGAGAPKLKGSIAFVAGAHTAFGGPRDLPILGHVKAGGRGFFVENGERHGVTVRPEALRDVTGAYAVRVHDESMSPALEPGYLLFVDPTRPVKPGDNVVIQLADGQAFIKRLVRRTGRAMICKQFNPAGEVKYEPAKVKSVHLVVQVSMIDL